MGVYQQVQDKLQELQIQPKRSLGQNFLISDNVVEKILLTASSHKPDLIVEIGPGLGSLTEGLIGITKNLKLIELDNVFFNYWKSRGLDIVESDALLFTWDQYKNFPNRTLVSNLPYQISSRLVIDRSLDLDRFQNMILMFQREVADRITTKAKSKDYGFLSVIAQSFWKIKSVTDAGPQSFLPPPNVTSRVLHFQRKENPVSNPKMFFNFIKAGFMQRRKLYLKNIKGFLLDHHFNEDVMKNLVEKHNLKLMVRAEEITVDQYISI